MTSGPDSTEKSSPIRLGALEQQVMDLLWNEGPLTVRQIIEALGNDPAYTTIATVLTNLERKQLVERERHGRSVLHTPTISREEHAATLMQKALVNGGDRAASILHFVEGIGAEDVELLRSYLNSKDERG
ncbi:BlaI/MecI/CopY family transcriptional regulator [Brevibacterium zhoupengii]|uniref:BlaI/MecI/CopY family transcriptional regulator n=1 Tax=Brevibacterium zhoupengii TaxID=2898795 RepID=UPI001F09CDD2|nr:BlaI/MecI/CopY family transcriptional regulator [Brevibacterium zhoupengii]